MQINRRLAQYGNKYYTKWVGLCCSSEERHFRLLCGHSHPTLLIYRVIDSARESNEQQLKHLNDWMWVLIRTMNNSTTKRKLLRIYHTTSISLSLHCIFVTFCLSSILILYHTKERFFPNARIQKHLSLLASLKWFYCRTHVDRKFY